MSNRPLSNAVSTALDDPFLRERFADRIAASASSGIAEGVAESMSALAEGIAEGIAERLGALLADRELSGGAFVEPVAGKFGAQQLITGPPASPASDFRYTVPQAVVFWPLSVFARLTCSAVVGDRSLTLEYQDGMGDRFLVAGANVTLAASQTQAFCWQPEAGVSSWPVNDCAVAPLPQQFLYPQWSLVLRLAGVQAGDQIDQVRLSANLYPRESAE